MIQIKDKTKCCGCTACANKCPKHCISMVKDDEGFAYPKVNIEECINCGLCDKVCPVTNQKEESAINKAFAVQHCDEETLYHSAAGGAFSAFADYAIRQNGVAIGAAYDEDMVVKHIIAKIKEEIPRFRSSKYVQSDQKNVYSEVKRFLDAGTFVCYSGTPCQTAGLKSFLEKDYSNLLLVDLVCKGVGSPEVLRQYVELMTQKYKAKIVGMNFKRKTYGYHSSTMSVDFENGKTYSKSGITDPMMRSFRANICLRPSCGSCAFKGIDRVSDLTIFDCWHFSTLSGKNDNDKGHTAVIVHSEKGLQMLKDCNDLLEIVPIDLDAVVKLDGVMVKNVTSVHAQRDEFMKSLANNGLLYAINQYIPITLMDRIKDGSKKILYKLGILNFVKRM